MAENETPDDSAGAARTAPAPPPDPNLPVELENLAAIYANFARVTGSPEELILDFGLNPSPFGTQQHPIKLTQRIVMNFFTSKRLLAALGMAVQRHEQAFGVLETDVNKRVVRR